MLLKPRPLLIAKVTFDPSAVYCLVVALNGIFPLLLLLIHSVPVYCSDCPTTGFTMFTSNKSSSLSMSLKYFIWFVDDLK